MRAVYVRVTGTPFVLVLLVTISAEPGGSIFLREHAPHRMLHRLVESTLRACDLLAGGEPLVSTLGRVRHALARAAHDVDESAVRARRELRGTLDPVVASASARALEAGAQPAPGPPAPAGPARTGGRLVQGAALPASLVAAVFGAVPCARVAAGARSRLEQQLELLEQEASRALARVRVSAESPGGAAAPGASVAHAVPKLSTCALHAGAVLSCARTPPASRLRDIHALLDFGGVLGVPPDAPLLSAHRRVWVAPAPRAARTHALDVLVVAQAGGVVALTVEWAIAAASQPPPGALSEDAVLVLTHLARAAHHALFLGATALPAAALSSASGAAAVAAHGAGGEDSAADVVGAVALLVAPERSGADGAEALPADELEARPVHVVLWGVPEAGPDSAAFALDVLSTCAELRARLRPAAAATLARGDARAAAAGEGRAVDDGLLDEAGLPDDVDEVELASSDSDAEYQVEGRGAVASARLQSSMSVFSAQLTGARPRASPPVECGAVLQHPTLGDFMVIGRLEAGEHEVFVCCDHTTPPAMLELGFRVAEATTTIASD